MSQALRGIRGGRRAARRESAEYFELSRDLLCTASADGYFRRVNPAWTRTLGHTEAELLSRPYMDFVHPDDRDATAAEAKQLAEGTSETVSFENRYRASDGSYRRLEWSARVAPKTGLIYAAARDVTEQRKTQDASRRLAATVRSSDDAIISTTLTGTVMSWNPAADRIFGYSPEEMIGKSVDALVPEYRKGEDVGILAEVFTRKERIAQLETERIAKDGSLVPVSLTISPIRDESGKLIGMSTIAHDVTERKVLEAEVDYMHRHDELTGLFSMREFEHELGRQLPYSRRYGSGGAVLVLDLDDLQWINASLGRHAGDKLLVHVARLLTDRLRTSDTIARLTGDQFGVLLPEADEASANKVADDLLERVRSRPAPLDTEPRRITCSVGIARFDNERAHTVQGLIAVADSAVEEAKRQGGDRVVMAGEPRIEVA